MTRVRGFTQDDAHLFCTADQVAAEVTGCLDLVKIVLSTLGMNDYRVRVGLRDPDSDKYVGSPENWDKAEAACREAVANARRADSPRSPARPRSTARRSTSSSRTSSAASGSSAPCRWTTTCP